MSANKHRVFLLALFLFILSTRIPFLHAGYGVEEDSWGMVNAAQRMASSGNYEVSRLPGHPVVESVYYLLANESAFVCNLITALISTIGILFFAMAAIRFGVQHFLIATCSLAFIPVVYINSTCNMDYMWALAFMMMSLLALLDKKIMMAGFFLGIAIGCRLTSVLMLFPFLFLMFDIKNKSAFFKNYFVMVATTMVISAICFYPAIEKYGWHLLADNLGYPQITKSVYKASVGVFGVLGCVALGFFLLQKLLSKTEFKKSGMVSTNNLNAFIYSGIAIHLLLYIWLPHKSAYLIPIIPFVVLWISVSFARQQQIILLLSFFLSNFMIGINLNDKHRGVNQSAFSFQKEIFSQPVSFDLFKGNLLADNEKRFQKMNFAKQVLQKTNNIKKPTVVIAGWWINEIEVLSVIKKNSFVQWVYFMEEPEMQRMKNAGIEIYYLPLQQEVNDLKFGKSFTASYATALFDDESNLVY